MAPSDLSSRFKREPINGFKSCRSLLFVPGSSPERFNKALSSGADRVIIDLEDAVSETEKESARTALSQFLEANPAVKVLVRINGFESPWVWDDLAFCAETQGVVGIMVPKSESADQLKLAADTGKPIAPLIESARGFLVIAELLQVHGVVRVSFGALDLCSELGIKPDAPGSQVLLDQSRWQLVMHSAANRIEAPIETIFPRFRDSAAVETFARRAKEMGFGGMLCIHPDQIIAAHAGFSPDSDEVEWARKVVSMASESGAAFHLDGEMIDAPVIHRAERIMSAAADERVE